MSENTESSIFTGQGLASYKLSQIDKANLKAKTGLVMGIVCASIGCSLIYSCLALYFLIPNSIWAIAAIYGAAAMLSIIALIKCIRAKQKGATSKKAIFGLIISLASLIMNGYLFILNVYVIVLNFTIKPIS